jgi:hypothetical protein
MGFINQLIPGGPHIVYHTNVTQFVLNIPGPQRRAQFVVRSLPNVKQVLQRHHLASSELHYFGHRLRIAPLETTNRALGPLGQAVVPILQPMTLNLSSNSS